MIDPLIDVWKTSSLVLDCLEQGAVTQAAPPLLAGWAVLAS